MKIIIDGREIEAREGQSILESALAANIFIPHLCSHPDLEAKGGCRLCSVEIDGLDEAVPSCMTKVAEGMSIRINGEKADKIRRNAMELILATHPAECTGCPKFGKCELQSMYQYMGVTPDRWRKKSRSLPNDDSNPLISHLFTRCIRCGRCIRACHDLRGVGVLDYIKTSVGIHAGVPEGRHLKDADCRFCGACIEVCPTGSIVDQVKVMRAERTYTDNVVPCKAACPAHIDIPRYIRYIKNGEFDKATAVVREHVPFPEVLGSICNHACESACKRGELGAPVSICRLKRAAANTDSGKWKERAGKDEKTDKKVAIVGAGPAGLTTAYYLAKKGHSVKVFEKNNEIGGQLRYGIPAYRLPNNIIAKEVAEITALGVEIRPGAGIEQPKKLLEEGFDAVLLATGTHQGIRLGLSGADKEGVYVNADFLKAAREEKPKPVGESVMVLGGGNVAYDCARTALRLGAKEVHIACLESREGMTATDDEIEEGAEEGIILHAGYSFLQITGKSCVEGVELQKVDKFYFDENRKAVIELVEETQHIIPVNNVIFAVGQKPEGTDKFEVELTHGLYIAVNDKMETGIKGIYAAGDVVTGTKSVIEAIAAGRKVAKEIDMFLGGDGDISETLLDKEGHNPYIGRREGFAQETRICPSMLDGEKRKCGFDLVEMPFSKEEAVCEASRCLQCDLRLDLTKPKLWNEY